MIGLQTFALCEEAKSKSLNIADDVTVHYVERGRGESVIFVHGLMDDYTSWQRQMEAFASNGYRAIAYSRRHNFPNKNAIRPNHSASLEADDLAALVRELKLEKTHVVGFSYGAYTTLFFALKYPELARSVTLIEPPVAPWLADLPGEQAIAAKAHLAKLQQQGVKRASVAIQAGDETEAIKAMVDAIGGKGKYHSLPEFVKEKCRRNVNELKAFLASDDRFPIVNREQVQNLKVPTLILSGGKSVATARFTDPELERLIPDKFRQRIIFDNATHILWIEQPTKFREAVLAFIDGK